MQEYWHVVPFPLQGHLSLSGIEPTSLVSPALAGGLFTTSATWEAHVICLIYVGSEVQFLKSL